MRIIFINRREGGSVRQEEGGGEKCQWILSNGECQMLRQNKAQFKSLGLRAGVSGSRTKQSSI